MQLNDVTLTALFPVWRGSAGGILCVTRVGGPHFGRFQFRPGHVLAQTLSEETQERSKKMHTTIQRLNGVFSFLTTVVVVLGVCIGLTSFLIPSDPISELNVSNFRVVTGRAPRSGSKATEFALLNFDLDAGTLIS